MTSPGVDRMALSDLVHRYAAFVDDREFQHAAELFTDTAQFVLPEPPDVLTPVRRHDGRAGALAALSVLESVTRTRHAIVGEVYTAATPDTAAGRIACVAHHWTAYRRKDHRCGVAPALRRRLPADRHRLAHRAPRPDHRRHRNPAGSSATPMSAFRNLLSPGRIGSMELRNRLVMSPMETMYGTPDGLPSERTVAYFAARAAGGVGLITVGATGIDPRHPETPGGLQIGTDAAVAAHRELVDAVHAHGAKIQPQIVHAGPDGLGPEMHGVASLGPSVIPSYLTGNPSEAVTTEQITAVLDLFRAAARRVAEAGYDGIELHAAHGYMFLGSFLAPQRNRRTDAYRGSSAEGRIQIVLDALAAIRTEIGHQLPITLRISGYERVAGGRPIDETARAGTASGAGRSGRLPHQRWCHRPVGDADGERNRRRRRAERRCRGGGQRGGGRPRHRGRPHP